MIEEKNNKSPSRQNKQQKKINFNHGKFFIEYFYTIGIDQKVIFEDLLYTNGLRYINQSSKIKPTIISKMPNVEKSTIKINDEILIKVCYFKIY
jgi:hypothetical protein